MFLQLKKSAATREQTMVGQKYFKGDRANERLGGGNKYNKINNNSENFMGDKIAARRGFRPPSCGPAQEFDDWHVD